MWYINCKGELQTEAKGYIFQNYYGQYELINEIGNVVETFNDLESAQKRYDELGYDGGFIDWDTLHQLREDNGQNKKDGGYTPKQPNPFIGH